jgi:ATP-binding cassette subfamily F protein 3
MGLQVGYSGVALFEAGDLEVERLERVALIGPNGSGKTTFLRTVLGQLEPVAGAVKLGGGLKIGYFAQAHDGLNPDSTVLDELLRHREMLPGEARQYLAQYLFRGEDVWKPVGALSGGERARLALAILAVEGVNCLLLDEPTNHLDIPAQEVLQEGLERFEGTLLMVSHDRYLVDRLATQIWELRDGCLHVFKGTYQEFLAQREREALSRDARAEVVTQQRQATQARDRQETGEREARKRAQTLAALESQIAQAEAALAQYSRQLQESGEAGDFAEMRHLADAYATAQVRLDDLMAEWTALAAECS